jgi:hypothetical protein
MVRELEVRRSLPSAPPFGASGQEGVEGENFDPDAAGTDAPDTSKLTEHELALASISNALDELIGDLLNAEAREYSVAAGTPALDSTPASRAGALKSGGAPDGAPGKRGFQEIIVMTILVAAIFLVGLSFGLWGLYFLGLR